MLADRLMAKTDYDTDRELHTLELLKLRFGETSLHDCEIMLKVSWCTESEQHSVEITLYPRAAITCLLRAGLDTLKGQQHNKKLYASFHWLA